MTKKTSIRLTAAFLMIVFSMNTVIGLACGMGMDLGFNKKCNPVDKQTSRTCHVNPAGKKNEYRSIDKHHLNKPQHNDEAGALKHANNEKHNCCNDTVMKFEQLEKSVAQNVSGISPVFCFAFLFSCYYKDIRYSFNGTPLIKYFIRSHHPPIPDIRIAIQSFQI